jgi:PCO_ADO
VLGISAVQHCCLSSLTSSQCLTATAKRCRFLFGDVDCQSYDWVGQPATSGNGPAPAVLVRAGPSAAGSVAALWPDSCNVHAFEAQTAGAMLDVLVPGYTDGAVPSLRRTAPQLSALALSITLAQGAALGKQQLAHQWGVCLQDGRVHSTSKRARCEKRAAGTCRT